MQVNFDSLIKAHGEDLSVLENFSAPCIMHLKMDILSIPKKVLPISHPASIVCCSFVRQVNKLLTGILRLIATSYANSTCEKDLLCSFFFYLW